MEERVKTIHSFPKIFAIGTDYISGIFENEVEITEKIDGSQFDFGKIGGELYMRSKGVMIFPDAIPAMFAGAGEYAQSIVDKIPDNTVFYCEHLNKPHHNTLTYGRVPTNGLILFGVSDHTGKFISAYEELLGYAQLIGIECVPLVYKGKIDTPDGLKDLLDRESVLGGTKIEGIVVKNYAKPFLLGGQAIPLMAGKFVSEEFKEVHADSWKAEHSTRGKWDSFKDGYRIEARWEKAVQHLRDSGVLTNSPQDIGKLLSEVKRDITEEEQDTIKEFLWREFGDELLRHSTGGLPEWYKEKLLNRAFELNTPK